VKARQAEGDLTDETLSIFLNRRLHRDILHLPCPSRLDMRHRRIRAPPKQTLQKQRWKEMRKLKGRQGCAGKLSFSFSF
jgi:hypothetical protein